ncbi:Isochorismatase family [Carpediemonas membranifera]|uniref:Isochorismatase family n=1 Tax=Carpediemonas membranifera TaxID=201153 RepID=A0A8J6BCM9_9EUKA|nr:Isochorismatase family [Carpediemonas membranifera]|eukprot:KAG9394662.1 Isochorismatase family [Carpediemonas membranifera]
MVVDFTKITELRPIFFLCDIQERFAKAMTNWDMVVDGTVMMLKVALELKAPVIVTEQYTKAFGPTVAPIREVLDQFPEGLVHGPFEKKAFGMLTPPVRQAVAKLSHDGHNAAVICGIETQVCVQQTTQRLHAEGLLDTFIPRDCVSSRFQADKDAALDFMRDLMRHRKEGEAEIFITTAESLAFNLIGGADHPSFKAISGLVKAERHREY